MCTTGWWTILLCQKQDTGWQAALPGTLAARTDSPGARCQTEADRLASVHAPFRERSICNSERALKLLLDSASTNPSSRFAWCTRGPKHNLHYYHDGECTTSTIAISTGGLRFFRLAKARVWRRVSFTKFTIVG